MPKLYDELRTLIDTLDSEKIEYALCGGQDIADIAALLEESDAQD